MPLRTRDKEATRQALMAAGRQAFAASGYEGARNQAIADAAGVNKAMINYVFDGKIGLFSAILLEDIGKVSAALDGVATSTAAPPDRLRELVSTLAEAAGCQPLFAVDVGPRTDGRRHASGARGARSVLRVLPSHSRNHPAGNA